MLIENGLLNSVLGVLAYSEIFNREEKVYICLRTEPARTVTQILTESCFSKFFDESCIGCKAYAEKLSMIEVSLHMTLKEKNASKSTNSRFFTILN